MPYINIINVCPITEMIHNKIYSGKNLPNIVLFQVPVNQRYLYQGMKTRKAIPY